MGEVGYHGPRGYYFQWWSTGVQHIHKEVARFTRVWGVREACVAVCVGATRDIHEWIDRRNTLTFGHGQVLGQ